MSDGKAPAKLNKVDKAAILLLSLGETDAAQVLRHLGPKEVQRVGVAMSQMRNVQREQVEGVMGEFVSTVGDQTSLGVGAHRYIPKMLTPPPPPRGAPARWSPRGAGGGRSGPRPCLPPGPGPPP